MQYNKVIPLKKILSNSLGKEKALRYLQGIEGKTRDVAAIYQEALSHLYNGDMEIAINYVVYGLDLDRNNKLLFNLCKNMTFLLSKHLSENNADIYRQKYNQSLEKAVGVLNKKITELNKKLEFENSNMANLNIDLEKSKPQSFFTFTKPYTIYLLKKRNVEKSIKIIEANIADYEKQQNSFTTDLDELESFVQVEEDVKALGVIMEVCILPSKYEWLANKQEKTIS